MADIKELRPQEMAEIINFYYFIQDYGHIFYGDNNELEKPFKKILEGIEEVKTIVDNYYSY